MEQKKRPEKDLQAKGSMHFFLGLCISIGLMISAFEWSTKDDHKVDIGHLEDTFEDVLDIPITKIPPPEPPKPIIVNPKIEEVDDEEEIEKVEFIVESEPLDDLLDDVIIAEPEPEEPEVFLGLVEVMPEPEGGLNAFYEYLSKHMKYPAQARRMGVEGKVFVQFVVSHTGEITDAKVVKGIGMGCDEEALKVLKDAPKWKPGRQRGRPVNVRMVVPIFFKLNK